MSKIKLILDLANDLKALADSVQAIADAITCSELDKKSEELQPEKHSVEKEITLEEVRTVMADKSRDGHRQAVRDIITKFGVNNLSSLDPKHYAVALKEAGDLK
jgi:hypothetical protein